MFFERPLEEKLLILSDPDDASLHKPGPLVGAGWSIGRAIGRRAVRVRRLQSKVAYAEAGYGSHLLSRRSSRQKRSCWRRFLGVGSDGEHGHRQGCAGQLEN